LQEKKSKIAQELAAHKQQMQGGGCTLSQGTRRILQERQRHSLKASQAAAAMAASGLLNQVHIITIYLLLCCAALCCAVLCCAVAWCIQWQNQICFITFRRLTIGLQMICKLQCSKGVRQPRQMIA